MVRETTQFPEVPEAIQISSLDSEILGNLMHAAYQGALDYEGESIEQSIQEVKETLDGKYGKVLWEASLRIAESSAVIFVFFEREKMPLLAYTMTHPDAKAQGLAKKLIQLGISKLSEMNYPKCCLVVTEGNQPAQSIYEKLGFQYKS
jgi:GNAT superfamily N-acetyltransferase